MKLTASKLRQDIFKILDQVLETGKPVEIERNGSILKIVPVEHRYQKLGKIKAKKITNEDSDNFIHIDWPSEWDQKK
jgi:prevent-host-death family protein